MRLWHFKLIKYLPKQQLLGLHRECCAIRGRFWGRKHSIVNYVWKYSWKTLYFYHVLVMIEMSHRNYEVYSNWRHINYRGKNIGFVKSKDLPNIKSDYYADYPEHNNSYLLKCLKNLKKKGINLFSYFYYSKEEDDEESISSNTTISCTYNFC